MQFYIKMENINPTKEQIREKYSKKRRRIYNRCITGTGSSLILAAAPLIASFSDNFYTKLNTYSSDPLVVQYNEEVGRGNDITRSLRHLEDIRGTIPEEMCVLENSNDLLERTFVNPMNSARLDSLKSAYEEELDRTEDQISELKSQEPVQNYVERRKKIMNYGFSLPLYIGIAGTFFSSTLVNFLSGRNRRKRDEELKKHGFK